MHFSILGDDVQNVYDKLENVKHRYGNLCTKCDDRQSRMDQAVPLAENFKVAHEKLIDFLQRVEPELRGPEPMGPEAEEQVQVLNRFLSVFNAVNPFYTE